MLRYVTPCILLLYCGTAPASECSNVTFYNDKKPTVTSISSDTENPRPGQEITITALVEAPFGDFSVYCVANGFQENNGGTIELYKDVLAKIGSVKINSSNAHSRYLWSYQTTATPGSPAKLYEYYGFNTSSFSVKYKLPPEPGTFLFGAKFSGDQLTYQSNSSALTIQSRSPDITPALMLLLN
ncbi:hypothetical protein JI752_009120 [Lysobacter sp. MMG2]|uniref:hypothetical protein n=1 Tax=Lysobacter sp. MMG2 TaxID=2801338 RepID=UPI001C2219E4|nr:hypothetical protein [Lysobacter sp. MMG2]MBU8976296.1 hypothetical protein [Lysobacter sp. MMG2]